MRRGTVRDVVVGVDDDPSALAALDWAAAEASARGTRLRIIHARYSPVLPDPYGMVVTVDEICAVREAGERLLGGALRRVRDIASTVPVTAHLVAGAPGQVLLNWSRDAALLVVGVRGLGEHRHRIPHARLAGHASCAVAVVHDREAAPRSVPTSPRVVLGVDGSGCPTPAMYAAFQAAAQRQVPLLVVHAHRPPDPAAYTRAWSLTATASIDRALQAGRADFPDVPVSIVVDTADPVEVLARRAAGAALVVVGSHVYRGVPTWNRRPLSHALVEQVTAPVLVVPRRVGRRPPPQVPGQAGHVGDGRADRTSPDVPPATRRARHRHWFPEGSS